MSELGDEIDSVSVEPRGPDGVVGSDEVAPPGSLMEGTEKDKEMTDESGEPDNNSEEENKISKTSENDKNDGGTEGVDICRKTVNKKFWLGGYRRKGDGLEYHNAETQTRHVVKACAAERNCRDTQTYFQRNKTFQTAADAATQMTKPGVYISAAHDRIIIPGEYVMAETIEANREAAAITIQKYFRRYLASDIVKHLKDDKFRYESWLSEQKEKAIKDREQHRQNNLQRRLNPRTEKDFELVWAALESWRSEKVEMINTDSLTPAEQKAALVALQEQTAQLVAAIGRHRTRAAQIAKDERANHFLDACAAPRRWKGSRDGKVIEMVNWSGEKGKFEMDTGYTLRAKELRDLYQTLKMDSLTVEERVDVLLTLKHTAAGVPDCRLTKEIISLCEREAELLLRGIGIPLLSGLRARILNLFLQFCREPTFNPEAARVLRVPQDPQQLREKVLKMDPTSPYLSHWPLAVWPFAAPHDFDLSAAQQGGRRGPNPKPEIVSIGNLMRDLRKNESSSELVFILSERDIQHLVQNIWGMKSALSNCDEGLVLTKWRSEKPWSPWNCFLITKNELDAHNVLTSPEEGYGPLMFQKVRQKHLMARQHFSRIKGMASHLREQFGSGIEQRINGTSIPTMNPTTSPN